MTRGDPNEGDAGDRDDAPDRRGIHIEFGLSLSDLLDGLLGGSSGAGGRGGRSGSIGRRPGGADASVGRPTRGRTDSGTTDDDRTEPAAVDAHVETYREDDQMTVVVDLPGVPPDEVSAGVGEETSDLVVLVDGAPVERVELPWAVVQVVAATFNNGVLEVRLRAVGEPVA